MSLVNLPKMSSHSDFHRENHFATTNGLFYGNSQSQRFDSSFNSGYFIPTHFSKQQSVNRVFYDNKENHSTRSCSLGVDKDTYYKNKENSNFPSINFNENSMNVEKNYLYFDKIRNKTIRHIPGHFLNVNKSPSRTQISPSAPEWFNAFNERRQKELKNKMEKEETLFVFSRYQQWITVTPKSKNRNRPIEKLKAEKLDKTSKVMPKWMQIDFDKKPENLFCSKQLNANIHINNMRTKMNKDHKKKDESIKYTVVVEKNQKNKSIFTLGDFRHNVRTNSDVEEYQKNLSFQPKGFFSESDKKIYHPKFRKDMDEEKIVKMEKIEKDFRKRIEDGCLKKKVEVIEVEDQIRATKPREFKDLKLEKFDKERIKNRNQSKRTS